MLINPYRFGGGGGDPVIPFANVLLQVQFTGVDGTTAFTDESTYARTLTTAGNAQILSNKLELDGTGDWVTAPDSADFTLSGDVTLECFGQEFDSTAVPQPMFSHWDAFTPNSNNRGWLLTLQSGALQLLTSTDGTGGASLARVSHTWTPSLATPYDIAYVRSGSNLALYIDGVRVATATYAGAVFNSVSPMAIGGQSTTATTASNRVSADARMKAVRITNAARYLGAAYTVPTLPLPTS